MRRQKQPSPAELEQVAINRPDLINAFVAYFVFEWQKIVCETGGLHGKDQKGVVRFVPDYVSMYGMDSCLNTLRISPSVRGPKDPGGISVWLKTT